MRSGLWSKTVTVQCYAFVSIYLLLYGHGRLTRGRAECPKTPVFVRYREGPLGWVSPAARRFPSGPSAKNRRLNATRVLPQKKTQRRTSACGLGSRTSGERCRNNGLQHKEPVAASMLPGCHSVHLSTGIAVSALPTGPEPSQRLPPLLRAIKPLGSAPWGSKIPVWKASNRGWI